MSDASKQPKRIILEMGSGTALYSGDYTKAAKRAVQEALYHSSLVLFRTLDLDPKAMQIELVLGAQRPEQLDLDAVAALLPYGTVTARAEKGGLDTLDPGSGLTSVTVNAAVIVRLAM